MKKINGFTLAEVLITLVIIGIIAAMTIPSLMNKTNEQETVVAVKKAYSILSQAYQHMVADYGEPYTFVHGSENATKEFGDMMAQYFSVQKNCGVEVGTDCWATSNGGMYKYFNGRDWILWNDATAYKMRLNDGTFMTSQVYADYKVYGETEPLKHVFGHIHVDINGEKGPNTLGKDDFRFFITKYGIIPCGTQYDVENTLNTCRTVGSSCTAWVIAKGNMDYLRKNVSW